jgi:hypothetical protein
VQVERGGVGGGWGWSDTWRVQVHVGNNRREQSHSRTSNIRGFSSHDTHTLSPPHLPHNTSKRDLPVRPYALAKALSTPSLLETALPSSVHKQIMLIHAVYGLQYPSITPDFRLGSRHKTQIPTNLPAKSPEN